MATQFTIKIKQDYYENAEDFKRHLQDAYFGVMDFARRGDDVPVSELVNDLYVIEFLLQECEITVEEV